MSGEIEKLREKRVEEDLRYVWAARVQCPKCGHNRHDSQRSVLIDGVRNQRVQCRECKHLFIIVWDDDDQVAKATNPKTGIRAKRTG